MSKFTPVYEKARDVIQIQEFAKPEWQKFLVETCGIRKLLASDGFDSNEAGALDKLREKIDKDSRNALVAFFVGGGVADVICSAAKNDTSPGSWIERAAALKMLMHVHRARKKGGQDVWVYSPPKAHTKQVFDELTGSEDTIKRKLAQTGEIFSEKEMELMCDALAVALKVSMDAEVKLGEGKDATKNCVKEWFLEENCKDADLTDAITKLTVGFKKIAAACNSSKLVFTDYLDWRKQRKKYFGGAFRGGEAGGFPVIYLEGAFTRLTGNSGKLWLCAETIVHELSHHELSTEDHRYDNQGLKPDKTAFPYAKAIDNADSWGYFAIDLAGYLSKSDKNNVLK